MATATNPLIGSLQAGTNPSGTNVTGTGLNPLFGWPGATGVNQTPTQFPTSSGVTGPSTGQLSPAGVNTPLGQGTGSGSAGNPGGLGNPKSPKGSQQNLNLENILTAQLRNALIPQFANMLFGMGGEAGNVFGQYANLGSPFYQQAQQSVFNQGVGQAQNVGAQARQQLASSGYGYTPSGVGAATIGGMNTAESQNLAMNFLQQLFQNEQLQLQGAQGLAGVASLFNPGSMFGNASGVSTLAPTNAQTLQTILSGLGALWGGGGGVNVSVGGGG